MVSSDDCLAVGLPKKDHNIRGQLGFVATRARPGRRPKVRNDLPKQGRKSQDLAIPEYLPACHHLRSGSYLARRGAN